MKNVSRTEVDVPDVEPRMKGVTTGPDIHHRIFIVLKEMTGEEGFRQIPYGWEVYQADRTATGEISRRDFRGSRTRPEPMPREEDAFGHVIRGSDFRVAFDCSPDREDTGRAACFPLAEGLTEILFQDVEYTWRAGAAG